MSAANATLTMMHDSGLFDSELLEGLPAETPALDVNPQPHEASSVAVATPRSGGMLARWLRRRRAARRKVDHAAWDLRERYGEAALKIAIASSHAPAGQGQRRFWRQVARRLR